MSRRPTASNARKRGRAAPEKARQAVCAFANDLPNHNRPGVVFIGVKDDGTVRRIEVSDRLSQTLSDIKTDGKIVPPPTLTVERRTFNNAAVAVVSVWPADAPPVRYDGRIWIGIEPRRGIASAQDESGVNEKRRYRDRDFDTHPIRRCPINELNRVIFEDEYPPRAVTEDVLATNDRPTKRLASTGMIASVDDPVPTVVGVLTVGKSARTWVSCAYVQFVRIRGTSWGDPVADERELDGTFDLGLRRLNEKMRATLTASVDFTSETTEIRSSPYPLRLCSSLRATL
jgi:ATP-dependent DNA helicase RecG